MFSARTSWDMVETELARAVRERRAVGLPLYDLTASNPTRCGFHYDETAILAPLAQPRALIYDPDSRGMLSARAAVCRYYAGHGAELNPTNVFLTPSTSEAYSYLFRVLCDPGDEVLIAQPSYPLFDFLAQIESVRLIPYPLFYDHGWHLDAEALRRKITPRTRAIALVHPNNPTGHFIKATERRELEAICKRHGLALIVDEVFLDYRLGAVAAPSFACDEHPVLTFVLSGLSKIAGLPQMKAAWIAAFGPSIVLAPALDRIEVIADTFLSMNTPVQYALSSWLEVRGEIRRQIIDRVRQNLSLLDRELTGGPVSRLDVEGGWYAVLRIPAIEPDEKVAIRLVREFGVEIYPGRFFGFSEFGWLVTSLLAKERDSVYGYSVINNIFK
ncbi:MAG TPA: pyridoxal phosphate-dependent aminotransferase [Acidobacteriaceae bacterium]|nr:pyridoxal phosphate-dependent aminotransferase [Acidobacteriaceae bacterium]